MYCQNCNSQNEDTANFCSRCGNSLKNYTVNNSSVSGDASFNAGQNNIITGNITIGANGAEPVTLIQRTKITPVSIAGHPVKIFWVVLSGILGVIESVFSIWNEWPSPRHTSIFILTAGLNAILFFLGVDLKRRFFVRIPHLVNLESDREGHIFFTEIGGLSKM